MNVALNKNTKMFLSYVLPSMIGMLIVGSYSIVDTVFIGQSAGEIGLASVAVTWPLVMLFGAVGDMLGTGAAIIISQSRGAGNMEKARIAFGNMLFWQVIVCAVIMLIMLCFLKEALMLFGATEELMPNALNYSKILIYGSLASMLMIGTSSVIRNDGRPVFSMWLTVCGLLLNMLLDYLFIFPLGYGVKGAAYATVMSQAAIAVAGLSYFATKYTSLRYSLSMFKIRLQNLRQILISGIPSLGNQLSIIAM